MIHAFVASLLGLYGETSLTMRQVQRRIRRCNKHGKGGARMPREYRYARNL